MTLPPIEGTLAKNTMEARFAASGAFVSLELTLKTTLILGGESKDPQPGSAGIVGRF